MVLSDDFSLDQGIGVGIWGFGRCGLRILALEGMDGVVILGAMKRDDGKEEKRLYDYG